MNINIISLGQNLAGLGRVCFLAFPSILRFLFVVLEDGELATENDGEEEERKDEEQKDVEDEHRSIQCHLESFLQVKTIFINILKISFSLARLISI